MLIRLIIAALALVLCCAPQVAADEKVPAWAQQWIDWAQSTNNPEFIEWSKKISTPKAIQLGNEWEEFLGYNAVDIVAKDKTAPNIKPGLVITPENVDQYESELRELLPYGFDYNVDRLKQTGYNTPLEMVIVPTHHAYQDRGYLEATKKYAKNCKLDDKGNLQGWVAGIPFPHPTSGVEMAHNYDRLTIMADNLNSSPCEFGLHGSNGKRERVEKIELHWRNYQGRIKVDPFPNIPGKEDVLEKGSIVALYPYDLRGFAAVRTRFKADDVEDSFVTYIPSMRRIRRLAGSNTQDPLVGSDLTWEDWKGWWSKMSQHDTTYEVIDEVVMLCPSFNPLPVQFKDKYGGWNHRYQWERRPVWVLKFTYNDPNYIYKHRIWALDKEGFHPRMLIYNDAKGRFWKYFNIHWRFNPDEGETDYWGGTMVDVINKHMSILVHTVVLNMTNITENLFNLRYLSSKAH